MMIGGGGGIVALIVALIVGLGGGSGPSAGPLPGGAAGSSGASDAPLQTTPEEEKLVDFISWVLDDVQNTFAKEFEKRGRRYERARLVLFRDRVESACGGASAAIGPFYCPGDLKAYIDLSFYALLQRRFGAPGDFAQAYVIAHEIGHHVQNLTGTSSAVTRAQRANPSQANALSVKLELQADCLAGVWAHHTGRSGSLEMGDIEEGLAAASAIGDDTLQKGAGQVVRPESFTHGSAKERTAWFKRGFESGREEDCNTF
jgi:predicted metalloprotease